MKSKEEANDGGLHLTSGLKNTAKPTPIVEGRQEKKGQTMRAAECKLCGGGR